MENKIKVYFETYWKYRFTIKDSDGNLYTNEDQDGSSIYRLGIEKEMDMVEKDGKFFIDGTEFIKI